MVLRFGWSAVSFLLYNTLRHTSVSSADIMTVTQCGVDGVESISMATKHVMYIPVSSSDGIHDNTTSPETRAQKNTTCNIYHCVCWMQSVHAAH